MAYALGPVRPLVSASPESPGPGGATADKPVGTVVIALTGNSLPASVRTFSFIGGRPQVRFQATQAALDMVRRTLEGTNP